MDAPTNEWGGLTENIGYGDALKRGMSEAGVEQKSLLFRGFSCAIVLTTLISRTGGGLLLKRNAVNSVWNWCHADEPGYSLPECYAKVLLFFESRGRCG